MKKNVYYDEKMSITKYDFWDLFELLITKYNDSEKNSNSISIAWGRKAFKWEFELSFNTYKTQ